MNLQDIIKLGTAPNPTNNTTIEEGKKMAAALAPFLAVDGVYINTTIPYPAEAAMIAAEELDLPADVRLFLHVQVRGAGRLVTFGVANWWRIVASVGLRDAVPMCLNVANPDWTIEPVIDLDIEDNADRMQDLAQRTAKWQKLMADVAALPGPAVAVVPDQPVPAMPDWDAPLDKGMLGSRDGDLSPMGTKYTSPAGVEWVKEISSEDMFKNAWKRVN